MFSSLKAKYEVIYFPVSLPEELQDNAHSMAMDDISVAKKHGVKVFSDLCKGKSWNETMLKVFANCERFITMNGGYSILASMFSGTNIIYSKPGVPECREIKLRSFQRWYPNINDVRVVYTPSYDELKAKIRAIYIDDLPTANILIKASRPNYLRVCMQSIKAQDYPNINVVFLCDSEKGVTATRAYDGRMIRVKKPIAKTMRPEGESYGVFFPYNQYLDTAQKRVSGYILCIDDDDRYSRPDSVSKIMEHVGEDRLVIWKTDFNGEGIKPGASFGKKITLYDVTGIGICYHTSKVRYTDWSVWKRADYRTAKKLSGVTETVWVDDVLTSLQDHAGFGTKKDLGSAIRCRLTYDSGKETIQYFTEEELNVYSDIFKREGTCIDRLT